MTLMQPRGWFGRRMATPRYTRMARMAPLPVLHEQGLRFTEWLLLLVLALAYLESLSDPIFGLQLHRTVFSHLPLLLLGPVLALHLTGTMLNRGGNSWGPILNTCWPLLVLAAFALTGSSVAKWALDEKETYLTFGTYLALLPLFAAAVPARRERLESWATALIAVGLMASLAATAGEFARFSWAGEALHETEYIVISGFFAWYYASSSRWMKFLAILLLVAAALVNHKLTGYIVAALAVLCIVIAGGWRRLPRDWRGAYGLAAVVTSTALVAVLALLYFEYREYLPSGNTNVRLQQYEAALRQFMASPIWGSAYLENSGEVYRESFRAFYIPTHSDILDILKHGGLIGISLFTLGYWKIFSIIHRAVAATEGQTIVHAYFVGARFFQVTALLTFAFNPLLLKGPFLVVIWGTLGLAVGMALVATRPRRGEPA